MLVLIKLVSRATRSVEPNRQSRNKLNRHISDLIWTGPIRDERVRSITTFFFLPQIDQIGPISITRDRPRLVGYRDCVKSSGDLGHIILASCPQSKAFGFWNRLIFILFFIIPSFASLASSSYSLFHPPKFTPNQQSRLSRWSCSYYCNYFN